MFFQEHLGVLGSFPVGSTNFCLTNRKTYVWNTIKNDSRLSNWYVLASFWHRYWRRLLELSIRPSIEDAFESLNPRKVHPHIDNTTVHSAARNLDFFERSLGKLVGHSPYSPNLAHCDFFLVPEVKQKIRGRTSSL